MTVSGEVDLSSGPEPAAFLDVGAVAAEADRVLNGAIEQADSASSVARRTRRITLQA
jgi:hypothetical protein